MSTCKRCGSYAINHTCHGRDGSDPDLCDVCYWRKRAAPAAVPDDELHDAVGLDVAAGIESADYVSPRLRAELGTPSHLRDKLWSDCKTDRERADFILSGRAFETGVIAHCIQAEVAMAFHRLALLSAAHVPEQVPDGYVLVPKEPTPQMVGEGAKKLGALYGHHMTAQCYRAMLAAAQKKEEGK